MGARAHAPRRPEDERVAVAERDDEPLGALASSIERDTSGEASPAPAVEAASRPTPALRRAGLLASCFLTIATIVAILAWESLASWTLYGLIVFAALSTLLLLRVHKPARPTRVAIIGSQASAVDLVQELERNHASGYTLVGWIALDRASGRSFPRPLAIGTLGDVASLVRRHRIDLLLVGPDIPRLKVFDELLTLSETEPVRACELSSFYELAFGHIPVGEINSAWFQYIMHPKFRAGGSAAKRAFDLIVGACVGLLFLPLLLISALLIKLDGGPALYHQRRIGERGRPFTMHKLRTMRATPVPEVQQWCSADDPRVTRVGHVLRRLHLDELPQLYNILRGEMSLVGPRPEQPELVTRLESRLEFYSRRHLIKPGLTGWAQIRCGYARSESGSARKLCHDLYYLKHRSFGLDLAILARTFVTLASTRSEESHAVKLSPPALETGARVDQPAPASASAVVQS